jgi:hypothetical protein
MGESKNEESRPEQRTEVAPQVYAVQKPAGLPGRRQRCCGRNRGGSDSKLRAYHPCANRHPSANRHSYANGHPGADGYSYADRHTNRYATANAQPAGENKGLYGCRGTRRYHHGSSHKSGWDAPGLGE